MKTQIMHSTYLAAILAATAIISGCKALHTPAFANRQWHISDYYGQIIDRDTTYRISFGERLIPADLAIISSADSMSRYPGMDRFLADILHTARLDSAEILFYTPHTTTLVARLNGNELTGRPSSITASLNDELPFTLAIYDDDMEDWTRRDDEMYTYTYFDRRKKQLLVVDIYNYGDEPIAQISVFQSNTGETERMGIPSAFTSAFFKHDLGKIENDIDFWAGKVSGHRSISIANYIIGRQLKHKRPTD